ncbi:DISARM system phospholipase D-like protein DrmC [Sphingopyxis sp. XHP0097]|uniref:Phospholipase D n=1 Tax=Sphingopyxis jiangsuensis TaxID=2871171 RepID=A0ABS7MH62_9SPHN|nr:DISARM system phospholipase D-like protein DrmC [Sphingopyxis jiangsuensis]MBY4638363.1 DISARM system phospholipase D-like protein DrmC [Sphingopyxis jiangsuensis]
MKVAAEAAFVLARMLSPSKIDAISDLMKAGTSKSKISTAVNTADAKQALTDYLDAIDAESISHEVAAAILIASSHSHHATNAKQSVELVVTGPSTPWVPARKTEQVLLDLIGRAKHELFLVSFVANNWKKVIGALADADARGVTIKVLLEASKEDGGTLDKDQALQLLKAVPKTRIYRWSHKDGDFDGGKVHAKIALADQETAFITSANFTGHAMERNIEAGLLVRGGPIPKELGQHLQGLADLKIITPNTGN